MKKITAIFLAITITALGAVFVFGQTGNKEGEGRRGFGRHGKFAGHGGGMMGGRMFRQLDLTDEQRAQMKTIRDGSRDKIKPLMEKMRETRDQLAELGADGIFDQAAVETLAASQAETMKQLIVEKERVKAEMFGVLTPEQKTKLAELKAAFKEKRQQRMQRFGEKKADQ